MAHLAPMWATRAPIVIQAVQKWVAVNEKRHGYHWAMLATPENSRNTAPPTSGRRPSRSTAWATPLTGGNETKRGQTSHSLASSRGTVAMPVATCTPWVIRYRPAGRGSTGNQATGCWWTWE